MVEQTNKTIAKNTLFLYFRMMFTMIISLYTSRVILQVLGVDDYGIYQAVGGIVGFLSFINGALSTGTSRFLTFELGTGDFEKLTAHPSKIGVSEYREDLVEEYIYLLRKNFEETGEQSSDQK